MQFQPFRLLVLLIPTQTQPLQTLENRVHRRFSIALHVRIIEPQNHGSAIVASVEPVKDERASAAHVQEAGGRGREAHTGTAARYCWMRKIAHIRMVTCDVTGR